LLVLFVGSGCAALIYEIAWFQLLQLVIGSTAVSMGVLLGTFMAGMCIGSLALPGYVSAHRHPLRVYAVLELGIGVIGAIVLFVMPLATGAYTAIAGQGVFGLITRALLCAALLLPPTILMGASLPAIARWIETTPEGVSWLGYFYGGNTAGAVAGSLLAGFYLLRVHDMPTATYVAVAINVVVAALAFALAVFAPFDSQRAQATATKQGMFVRRAWAVYVVIALSGMAALGAEAIWTRLLSLLLGGTTYTFSIILAVFLIGIGIGSSAGAALSRGRTPAAVLLGVCQLLIVVSVAWAAYMMTRALPYWPIDPGLSPSPRFTLEIDFARVVLAVLPAALLWGASFPLALAAAAEPGQDPGRLVGGVYAANTVGAIVGALLFSIFVVPAMGTQNAQRTLMVLAGVAALLMLAPLARRAAGVGATVALAVASAVALVLVWTTPSVPFELIAYGRQMPWRLNEVTELYRGEGRNASIAVSQEPDGNRDFHVSGKVEASTEPQDMRLQRMLGAIPALLHPDPKSVLVVGFGAGVTAGSLLPFPTVASVRICELEPLIPTHVGPYFAEQNFNVLNDPRVTITYDDARHFIVTTHDTYDIITSDPIHPWVKGAATLYTKEYFELVKAHLNPGGLVTQWVPLYESNDAAVQSEIATFFSVFPNGTIWGNTSNGQGYDLVLLGSAGPLHINLDSVAARLAAPSMSRAALALGAVGFNSVVDLFSTYAGRASDLGPWMAGAQLNLDRNLRLQYLAGLTPDSYKSAAIYAEMLRYRQFPADLITGTPAELGQLRAALGLYP
jgi:spermidine synthase